MQYTRTFRLVIDGFPQEITRRFTYQVKCFGEFRHPRVDKTEKRLCGGTWASDPYFWEWIPIELSLQLDAEMLSYFDRATAFVVQRVTTDDAGQALRRIC